WRARRSRSSALSQICPIPTIRSARRIPLNRYSCPSMWQLFQFPLCPFSRKVRLVLSEKGIGHELVRENPWEQRDEFIDLNPAGETPVMVEADQAVTLIGSQP